ncbi:phage tail protein [Schinkia azotoformans]|uniref:Tail fiber repeat 2 protein n=1 Tax=Schinkia azotoformans LMG 9581 TaxID=1131731 RepID=K6D4V2_SCHAZ|nr:hypothetical protein [Schinkia azotoformans]EKN67507.1 tail fiber repeat 2 protein [Schinkia azotoformans LMG 9581]MEC1637333.1 phage tail protein [Schinkia azotoformans]MEC1943737.1 phage tail protein [Schinkia azotoformans]
MPRKVLIQIRRGLEKDIGTLAVGELGYCTDTQKLYVGTASGNVLLVAAQTVGDMLKSIYDTNNNGKVDAAETADTVLWSGIKEKPDLVRKDGDIFTGKVTFPAGVIGEASLNLPHGVAPSSPENGDLWTTTSGLFVRLNGTTRTLAHTSQWSTISQAEAEAGTSTTARLVSGQRIAQAIAAQAMPKGPLTWNDLKGV